MSSKIILFFGMLICSWCAAAGAQTLSASSLSHPMSRSLLSDSAGPNPMCIAFRCGIDLAACKMNPSCDKALNCVQSCKSADPVAKQRCQIICTESNPSAAYDNLVGCMLNKGCMPAKSAKVCDRPRQRGSLAPVTLSDLEGAWYVISGLSPAYDCWSCQKLTFTRESEQRSRYDYEYVVKAPTKSTIPCTLRQLEDHSTSMESATGGRFEVNYTAHNIPGKDDWYVLGYTVDYAFV